jgi:serine/threonine protein phosphatase PrpC
MLGTAGMRIEVGPSVELALHDTLLLGSDGLFDNLLPGEIANAIRKGSLTRASQELAERCSQRMHAPTADQPSKPDDLTFLLFRLRHASRWRCDGP